MCCREIQPKKKKILTEEEREITFNTVGTGDIPIATDYMEELLDSVNCPSKVKIQLDIALDEIISNIVKYAYKDDGGPLTLKFSVKGNSATVIFTDAGKKYNPLVQADPDTTLSAEERNIGGLGLFMVRKTMTDISYEYKDKKNIFTIRKDF